jgi:putative lipoprotein
MNRHHIGRLAALIMGIALSACGTGSGGDPLAGTRWELTSFAGKLPVSGTTVTVEFGPDNAIGGQGGCNSYGGSYQVRGAALRVENTFSTMMACVEAERMDQESAFLMALSETTSFQVEGDTLTLTSADGAALTFRRLP